jgi:16S rRNA (uracil1498-N3)-methyltransferase
MRHFYFNSELENGEIYTLPEEESKHLCKVLRIKEGDEVALLNGKGMLAKSFIHSAHPKRCEVQVSAVEFFEKEPYTITLAISPTKTNDRIEFLVEKATELGVHKIIFLDCKNNERSKLRMDRLKKITISAMKQSKRYHLPILEEMVDFNTFVDRYKNGYIAHCEDKQKEEFITVDFSENNVIAIGPEGDFTEDEIRYALENGFKALSLGKTRLRTETAGLYACMLMKNKLEQ